MNRLVIVACCVFLFCFLITLKRNFLSFYHFADNNSWYLPSARGSLDPLTMQTDPATPCGDAWRTQDPPVRCCSVEGPCAPDIVFSKLPSGKGTAIHSSFIDLYIHSSACYIVSMFRIT